MREMRILFIASDLNQFGGIQLYNRTFLNVIREQKKEVILVQLKNADLSSKIICALKVFLEVIRCKPDLIFCTHLGFAPLCYLIKILFGNSYVVTLYGIDVSVKKTWIEARALRAAQSIILIFEWAKKVFEDQFPDLSNKIFLLPSPVDGKCFTIKKKPEYLEKRYKTQGKKVIITVARLMDGERGNKGYQRVIRALPAVIKKIPNIKYVLIGKGDETVLMEQLIRELDIENNVVMAGAVTNEELPDHYNLADVYVMPSKNEGFGIVFMEALISGCPVIAGQYSKRELLDGELGISVDPQNQEELEEAITMMLENLPAHFRDKEELRKKALELYGLDMFKMKLKKFLELAQGL